MALTFWVSTGVVVHSLGFIHNSRLGADSLWCRSVKLSKLAHMFEQLVTDAVGASEATAVLAWDRMESASCARRLMAMVTLLDRAHAAAGSAARDQWCIDNWDAVTAHIGALHHRTPGITSHLLLVGVALRERLPNVLALFLDGLIEYRMARAIVIRTTNVLDPDAQRALDAELAAALLTWGTMSIHKTEQAIDALVAKIDPHALRRTQTRSKSRSLEMSIHDGSGMATVWCTLYVTDATALYQRADALADTVCLKDPRTKDERRCDAVGAIGRGEDRLTCLCGDPACLADLTPPVGGTTVYVVAHTDTLNTPTETPPGTPQPDPEPDGPTEPEPEAPDATVGDEPAESDPPAQDTEPAQDTPPAPATDEGGAAAECAALDGPDTPWFAKPLHELTLTEALTPPPGRFATIRPGALMGGQFLPGAITRRAALNATLVKIIHPGQAPPERRYSPSKKLADFVRCRDQTCRFPGCKKPATRTDVDHTVPWPYGPTAASNLKCLCRRHHLLKTHWVGEGGWQDRQLPDGTVIWTAPDGREHVTTPGSRLLFPELCEPTATVHARPVPPSYNAGLKMPRRSTTRAHDRLNRILAERELNRLDAQARAAQPTAPEPPPPF